MMEYALGIYFVIGVLVWRALGHAGYHEDSSIIILWPIILLLLPIVLIIEMFIQEDNHE